MNEQGYNFKKANYCRLIVDNLEGQRKSDYRNSITQYPTNWIFIYLFLRGYLLGKEMKHILFVCTANRYRSPIAEACLKKCLEEQGLMNKWMVASAGTWTKDGLPAMKDAVDKASAHGLDISAHTSRVITEKILSKSDLVIVMEQGQKEALQNEFPKHQSRIALLSQVTVGLPYDIPDPVIKKNVGDVSEEICEMITNYYENLISFAQ